ncbi:DUF2312 domain-containing protein [Rhodopseudomonas palustris]|nr:DUF2312 domain-containing protein [Rhodopseudomonas palustris]
MAKDAKASNEYDPELVKQLVGKIEGYHADLRSEHGSYMQACQSIRQDIGNVYEEAKARGIPKKHLKLMVQTRQKIAAARSAIEDLEHDEQMSVLMLAEAFGDAKDLPLFQSAISAAAH